MLRDRVIDLLRPFQFRGKARALGPLVPRSGEREAWVHGCRMRLDLSDHIQRHVYLGAFERHETRFVRGWLRPGDVFVDVGANVGYFTALAARCVGPAGRVLAFEPSPYAFERLLALVRDNALDWVHAEPLALSDVPGELDLPLPLAGNHTPSFLASGRTVRVRSARLDERLAAAGVEVVDLLKLDVEGWEPRVLDGATTMLPTGRVRAILVELNGIWLERAGSSVDGLWDRLRGLGFDAGVPRPPRVPPEAVLNVPFIHRAARRRSAPPEAP